MGDLFASSGVEEVPSTGDPEDPFPGLIRPAALRDWFDHQGLGTGFGIAFKRVKAGESNEVFTVRRGDLSWILRRPSDDMCLYCWCSNVEFFQSPPVARRIPPFVLHP